MVETTKCRLLSWGLVTRR